MQFIHAVIPVPTEIMGGARVSATRHVIAWGKSTFHGVDIAIVINIEYVKVEKKQLTAIHRTRPFRRMEIF
jgi:hypothetical protein